MRSILAAFLMSLGVAALLTPLVRRLALRLGATDAGGGRKIHVGTIPRMGGLAIVIGFFAPLTALLFIDAGINRLYLANVPRVAGLFLGGMAIMALGLWDDLKGADAPKKFAVQFSVGLLVYACDYRVERLSNPFGSPFELEWLSLPVTLLWVAGVINALNLIDGLDGLAGGVAVFVLATLFGLAGLGDRVLTMLFCAALGGATVGFLFYNFNPATIFMGDTGSLFLGFVIAVMSMDGSQKSSTAVAVAIPLLALGLPLADTALAMFRRALRGRSMFSADREHIHHKLLDMGFTHRQAVLVLYAASFVLASLAFALVFLTNAEATALLVVVGVVAFALFHRMGYLQLATLRHEVTVGRATSRALRDRRESVRAALAPSPSGPLAARELVDRLRSCAPHLGFDELRVTLRAPVMGLAEDLQEVFTSGETAGGGFVVTYEVRLREAPVGEVSYVFRDGRARLEPDEASLLDVAQDSVGDRLAEASLAPVVPLRREAAG